MKETFRRQAKVLSITGTLDVSLIRYLLFHVCGTLVNDRPGLSFSKSEAFTDEEVCHADKLAHLVRAGQCDRNWTKIFHLLLQQ